MLTAAKWLFLAMCLSLSAQISFSTVLSGNSIVYGVPVQYFILTIFATGGGAVLRKIGA